jgi:hypothetical protein
MADFWNATLSQAPYFASSPATDFAGSLNYTGTYNPTASGTDWGGLLQGVASGVQQGQQDQGSRDTPDERHRSWREAYFAKLRERLASMRGG